MQAPVLDASSPGVTPDRPPPQDISVFTVPKKPPVLESSGERPLRDIDLATPAPPAYGGPPGPAAAAPAVAVGREVGALRLGDGGGRRPEHAVGRCI